MKKLFSAILFFTIAVSTLSAQNWKTDFEQAQKEAKESNKKLIMVFQGSDWCAPCMKLNREIWSSDTFQSYAKDHYVMLKVDFPRKKANALPEELQAENGKLAETYNKKGYFPLVVLLDSQGKVIGETGYKNVTPDEYINLLNAL
ncbi:thioredoxin family protein [Mangrovibacterium lignilyticum]|uniref:thioredoxin family protein n=1 Tax=Mangrovibacterium lignilyticum TaxID=2668052 RepID=UPI0013D4F281|nr:thioredoxin family protein [Mangrovibacterium lignilyticum]